MPRRVERNGPQIVAGQLLAVAFAATFVASAPLLGMSGRAWLTLLGVTITTVAVMSAATWLPWYRWPRSVAIVFPLAGFVSLISLGLGTEWVALAFVGLIPLWFVYAGVFLPMWSGVGLVPAGLGAYVAMYGGLPPDAAIRLTILGAGWLTISSALCVLVARQSAVADTLRAETRTDALTTLGNRRGLESRLVDLDPGDCVVLCDLDLFKSINDSFGHAAGDDVLARFGRLIDQQLRRRDYAARYGGEEFVLLLIRTEPDRALAALASLRDEWLDLGEGVTFSAGIARVNVDRSPGAALAAADAALYDAKASGRDRFTVAP